jgi:hypothetical protein
MKGRGKTRKITISVAALVIAVAIIGGICVAACDHASAAGGNGYDAGNIIYSDDFVVNVLPLEIELVSGENYFSIPMNGEVERIYRIANPSAFPCDIVVTLSYADGYGPVVDSGYGYSFRITGPAMEEEYYTAGSLITVNPGEELFITLSMSGFYPAQTFPLGIDIQYPYTPRG